MILQEPEEYLQVGSVMLDVMSRQLKGPNGTHRLTPKENLLLRCFMLNPGRVVSRAFLMEHVWDTDWIDDCRTLEVHVCWLRKKIGDDLRNPQYLRTIYGVGYKFNAQAA